MKTTAQPHIVAVILKKGAKFLLCRRIESSSFKNFWQNPGGKVEKGESLLDAIVRETKEETGLAIPHSRFHKLETRRLSKKNYGDYKITTYKLLLKSQEIPQQTEDKHGPWRAFTLRKILTHKKVVPGLQKCLAAAL